MSHETKSRPDHPHVRRRMAYEWGTIGPEHEADVLEGLCEGFVRANQIQLRADIEYYPCCLGCGEYLYVPPVNCVVWDWKTGKKTDPHCQNVKGAYPLQQHKQGTCIDLACMLCAIFREKDGDRAARVIIEHEADAEGKPIPGRYHAMVMKGDGEIVDPTKKVKAARAAPTLACGCGKG